MLDILHQDDDLLILNKPPGLLCVPGLSDPANLFDLARKFFPNLRIVHRLDMATSGIVIFALNHGAQKNLGHQFERRQVKKRYVARVEGTLQMQSGEIVAPLICDWERRPMQKIDWQYGKPSHTYFQVQVQSPAYSDLILFPVTGRSHQLRVHCQFIGHPIVGDRLYNPATTSERMLLHAEYIQFLHPSKKKVFELYCQPTFTA